MFTFHDFLNFYSCNLQLFLLELGKKIFLLSREPLQCYAVPPEYNAQSMKLEAKICPVESRACRHHSDVLNNII